MSGPVMSRRRALASLLAPAVASCFPDSILAPFDGLASSMEPVTLIGAGDVHAHKNKASIVRATAALVQADPSAVAFVIGDNAETVGSAVEYGYYNDYWGSFRDRTLFMIGDHEYLEGTGGTCITTMLTAWARSTAPEGRAAKRTMQRRSVLGGCTS